MRTKRRKREFDWQLIAGLLLLIAISAVGSVFLQPLLAGKTDAINTIVTVFSILAGFLVAVITFIGEPSNQSWQEQQLSRRDVVARLSRHLWLFYFYLATLGLAMAMYVVPEGFPALTMWLQRLFAFFAIFVFGASFALPRSLLKLQLEKYDRGLQEKLPPVLKRPDSDS
ncbi:hypothetical protein [Paragemmobacter straminiformis]|uniref:Uncharacterized protein n=1 Tax=Paragemmobacter straminiformis TaxID=2045119 RepID=A0A842I533_9RHOB|nr:hypothetical protein [Gemmobacter straminiformis]MBC2834058.1 hypothetical protein [Gemmobacter straminiformis]